MKIFKLVCHFIVIVLCVISFIAVLFLGGGWYGWQSTPYHYSYPHMTAYETYGGDAYTGIQNAAADAANNIKALNEDMCKGLDALRDINNSTNSNLVIVVDYLFYISLFGISIIFLKQIYEFVNCFSEIIRNAKARKAKAQDDIMQELSKYAELLEKGIITQEDFDAKKVKLLDI